jgi:apolipoprotein N-acyltransferase
MSTSLTIEGPGSKVHDQPQPAPLPAPSAGQRSSAWGLLVLAGISAGLLWACYFPLAWGGLAWLALVPLLFLVRATLHPFKIFLIAWFAGLAFYLPALQWLRVADDRMYFTWIFLAFCCSLYLPLAIFLVRFLERRCSAVPLLISFPMVWVALEFFRANFMGGFATRFLGHHLHDFPGGFSWYSLGHSQHQFLPLIQIADLGGVYVVSFLVAMSNVLLFEVVFSLALVRDWFRPGGKALWTKRALLVQGLLFLGLFVFTLAYGAYRLGQQAMTPGPRVALIQGNLDQRLRNHASSPDPRQRQAAAERLFCHFLYLSDVAAGARPDLIVWPETSAVQEWWECPPGQPGKPARKFGLGTAHRFGSNILFGMNATVIQESEGDGNRQRRHRYNSAVLIDRQGKYAGRYDKIHRVPMGEYVPFRQSLPWLNHFAPYDFDYSVSPGKEFTRFHLSTRSGKEYTFGVVICYEDTDPDIARPYGGGDGAPPADFILNISNDGWFDGSSEHDEHLAICRFRAIETRRSVARAVNMGISAVIDSNGRVLQPEDRPVPRDVKVSGMRAWQITPEEFSHPGLPVSRWSEFKKVPGVLLACIPIDSRTSLYAHWGDWPAWTCWGGLLVGLVLGFFRRPPGVGPHGQQDIAE